MQLISFANVTFANHSHSQKTQRLNTREHFWIYGMKTGKQPKYKLSLMSTYQKVQNELIDQYTDHLNSMNYIFIAEIKKQMKNIVEALYAYSNNIWK